MIRSRKVLDSANGKPCSARFPGICNGNPETTVWAHLNGAAFGKGMGIKAHDVLGFHSCSSCHAYYDVGHGTRPILTTDELLGYILSAVCETWVRLIRDGIIIVPLDPERLSSAKPVKPRKPPEDRAKISGRGFSTGQSRSIPSRPFRAKEST
ncbi:MAG: nuclease domain-containing protein [Devosia sp.]